ncbi:MAG: ArgE/DapE family deacylase [Peptoniphilaceae bacterium]|nr:ArgE/DapE family deacylase [Peptoniphilaceae bacterium]MDY6018464.1 ArgE/DapE family deacylase [Anaerococcus sp.]
MIKENEKIDLLQKMISINTVNGNEKELANFLKAYLGKYGIEAKLVDLAENRSSLIAEIQNGPGKTLAISGHLDVVDIGNESEWKYPPFSATIANNVLWGRGASDMKSGLAALILALIEVNEEKNFHGKIRLIATVGEEIGELGSAQLTDLGYIDDVDSLIIAEPCNLGVVYAHKGSLNYNVKSKGVTAHSSAPQIGVNAIENLSKAISKITEVAAKWENQYEDDILGKLSHSITLIKGGTQVNSIPDYAEFEANVRTIRDFDNNKVIAEITKIISDINLSIQGELSLEVTADQAPVVTDPNSDLIKTIIAEASKIETLQPQSLLKAMGDVIGVKLTEKEEVKKIREIMPITVPGTTDAAQFMKKNKNLNLAVYGPGMPMLNHKVNERINLEQYLDFVEVYINIINQYMK